MGASVCVDYLQRILYAPLNFLGGLARSPVSGWTTHLSSTSLQETKMVPCKLLQFIIYAKNNVCSKCMQISQTAMLYQSLMNTNLNTQFQTTLLLGSRLVAICGLKGNTNMGVTSVVSLQHSD